MGLVAMAGPLTHDYSSRSLRLSTRGLNREEAARYIGVGASNAGGGTVMPSACGFEIDPEGKLAHLLNREMDGLVPRIFSRVLDSEKPSTRSLG
jgi:hypothetical protein